MARILVVDDSDDMRRLFVHILSRGNHKTSEAANGLIGFERLISDQFDLAVLDVMMPSLDGLTLCRMLRENSAFSALPVVIVSGASTEDAAISAGADAFLNKPFRPSRLLAIIDDLVTNGRPGRPTSAALPAGAGLTGSGLTGSNLTGSGPASADTGKTAVAATTSPRPRRVQRYRRKNEQVSARSAGASPRRAKAMPEQSA